MSLQATLDKIKASKQRRAALVQHISKARTLGRRPYQEDDILWAQQQDGPREPLRCISGMAPGLGKTFWATETLVLPAIVACPLNLVGQWQQFIEDQYPHWRVVVAAYGDVIKRDAAIKSPFDVLIVNHDMFRTYAFPPVQTLVVDEIHHFRNRETKRSKWIRVYAHRTPYVLGLTATPVYKDVGDLWHQLAIIDKDYQKNWGSYNQFLMNFAYTSSSGWGAKVIGTRNERLLKTRLKPYIRERTYREVGMFLPERIDKHVVLELDPKFRKNVYDELRNHFRLQLEGMPEAERFSNAGAVLHKLREILITDEKLQAVADLIDDVPDNDPVIVFVWYKETARKVAEKLDGVEITGDMDSAKRREIAISGGPDKKRVRVATMASMSEGVDLSMARTVFFVEEDYVPGRNYQAMTRVQRHSTSDDQRPVNAYWVRYKDTVDSIVHQTAISRTQGNAMTVLKEALGL